MSAEKAGWTTDEDGVRVFEHKDWTIKVWGPEWSMERMQVRCPSMSCDVWIYEEFIDVHVEAHAERESGSVDMQWPVEPCKEPGSGSVDVPWSIVKAMIEELARINERHTKTTGGGEQ